MIGFRVAIILTFVCVPLLSGSEKKKSQDTLPLLFSKKRLNNSMYRNPLPHQVFAASSCCQCDIVNIPNKGLIAKALAQSNIFFPAQIVGLVAEYRGPEYREWIKFTPSFSTKKEQKPIIYFNESYPAEIIYRTIHYNDEERYFYFITRRFDDSGAYETEYAPMSNTPAQLEFAYQQTQTESEAIWKQHPEIIKGAAAKKFGDNNQIAVVTNEGALMVWTPSEGDYLDADAEARLQRTKARLQRTNTNLRNGILGATGALIVAKWLLPSNNARA